MFKLVFIKGTGARGSVIKIIILSAIIVMYKCDSEQ